MESSSLNDEQLRITLQMLGVPRPEFYTMLAEGQAKDPELTADELLLDLFSFKWVSELSAQTGMPTEELWSMHVEGKDRRLDVKLNDGKLSVNLVIGTPPEAEADSPEVSVDPYEEDDGIECNWCSPLDRKSCTSGDH